MNDKLTQFLDSAFKPYGSFPARRDVEQELLANLLEKYDDLKTQGKTDDEAYQITTESFGDLAEIMEQVAHSQPPQPKKRGLGRTLITAIKHPINGDPEGSRFRAANLADTDLSDTELQGSDFSMSALMNVNFDGASMQGSIFKAAALKGVSFVGTELTAVHFDSSDLTDANLSGANLATTRFRRCAFKGATLAGATLDGTEFNQSDLNEISFDDLTLNGTIFEWSSLKHATFSGAVLSDVSFLRTDVKHTNFDGATMDKITYALLKGAKAKLDNVTIK